MTVTLLEEAPPLLAVTKEQAGRRPGAVWREADRGNIVVVYGPQDGTACVVMPLTSELLAFLGHDPGTVRSLLDGTTDDSLVSPEVAEVRKQMGTA